TYVPLGTTTGVACGICPFATLAPSSEVSSHRAPLGAASTATVPHGCGASFTFTSPRAGTRAIALSVAQAHPAIECSVATTRCWPAANRVPVQLPCPTSLPSTVTTALGGAVIRMSGGGAGGAAVATAVSTCVCGGGTGDAATEESDGCVATAPAARAASARERPNASAATIASAPTAPPATSHRGRLAHRRHQSLTMSTPVCTVMPATGVGIMTVASVSGVDALPNNWMSSACRASPVG